MTAIIGHRLLGKATLATDTRRRDHVTQDVVHKNKLHHWSDQLIFAQGGAGTNAADYAVDTLLAERSNIKDDYKSVTNFLLNEVLKTDLPAVATWQSRGKTIPPTYIVLATVDKATGFGFHQSIDLINKKISFYNKSAGPFFTGTNTPLIKQLASECYFRHLPSDSGTLRFDRYVSETVEELEAAQPENIGLPVDVGFVSFSKIDGWTAKVSRSIGPSTPPDFDFELGV